MTHCLQAEFSDRYAFKYRRLSLAGLLVSGSLALIMSELASGARPEPPTIDRATHMIEDGKFLHPHIPAFRTSNDGRIALENEDSQMRFYLYTPEKVPTRWHNSPPGSASILSDPEPFRGGIPLRPGGRNLVHRTLCETTNAFPDSNDDVNPYTCGANGQNDCYDLTHVGWTRPKGTDTRARLWGTKVRVEVANPKTAQARIVDVEVGESVRGNEVPGNVHFETAVTSDGRLLLGRVNNEFNWSWYNAHRGRTVTGNYQMVYSLLEDGADACDVREWKNFFPIAYAPYDPRLKGKYGIADFPFQYGDGQLVSEESDFGGSYPWVDREGNNIFMTTFGVRLSQQTSHYPNRCVPGTRCINREANDPLKGVAVVGRWTRGKLVHIDNLVNNTDWGIPLDPGGHRMVTLYERPNGSTVEARAGSGGRGKREQYDAPSGRSNNSAIIDSVEVLFNHDKDMRPRSPQDVVWLLSDGKATDEIIFDDYLNPDAFIISSMIATLGNRNNNGAIRYGNGGNNSNQDVHLQNAAASSADRWRTPAYGLVTRGTGRAEPIALGGIHGRGFWLDGSNEVRYSIPDQPRDPAQNDWYAGIYVDSRFADDNTRRTLLDFPDGTSLSLNGRSELIFASGNQVLQSVALNPSLPQQGWAHLGFNLSDGNREVTVFYNGFEYASFSLTEPVLAINAGNLSVGGSSGFKGWIDEFKVFAQNVNSEMACNHAGGTLVGIRNNASWKQVADRYPAGVHSRLSSRLSAAGAPTTDRYACYVDYDQDGGIDVYEIPDGTVSIREAINFPEGPVVHNAPRPDSTSNTFCLSCHQPGEPEGLTVAALEFRPGLLARDDPRRQPSQHLRMVHGNIPAGWLDGKVTEATQVGREGFMLDPILMTDQPRNPNDPIDLPVVSFNSPGTVVDESAATFRVEVMLSKASTTATKISVSTVDESATQGEDFYGTYQQVEFAPGETRKNVEIVIVDDELVEPAENFRIRLFQEQGLKITEPNFRVTIEDDDAPGNTRPVVSVSSSRVSESDGQAMVLVALSNTSSEVVTVEIASQRVSASNGSDYYGIYQTIRFAAGETRKQIPVRILNDTRVESEEYLTVRLFNPVNSSLGTSLERITIEDDD